MQENIFSLIGRCVDQAARERKTIHLYFNDVLNPVTSDFLVKEQCEHWEVSPDGVRPVTNPDDAETIKAVLNAEIVRRIALPYGENCERWNVVVRYGPADTPEGV